MKLSKGLEKLMGFVEKVLLGDTLQKEWEEYQRIWEGTPEQTAIRLQAWNYTSNMTRDSSHYR